MIFKTRAWAVMLVALLAAGCAQPERSRTVNDPRVNATTIAQQVCSLCHGVSGSSSSPAFPKLAGQPREYLVAQLSEFRHHSRATPKGTAYMWGFDHLTETQVQGLADYFSAQKPTYEPPGDATLMAEGKRIFTQGLPEQNVPPCAACHGAQGQGNGQFPRLAGQHADYVVKQLQIFQQTDQRPLGAPMKAVAHELTDRQIHALAEFVQSYAN